MRVQGVTALLLVGVGALGRRRLPRHGRVHRAGVLALLPARRALAVRAARARAASASGRSRCRCTRCCRCCSAPSAPTCCGRACRTCYSQALGGLNAAWIGVAVLAVGARAAAVRWARAPPVAVAPPNLIHSSRSTCDRHPDTLPTRGLHRRAALLLAALLLPLRHSPGARKRRARSTCPTCRRRCRGRGARCSRWARSAATTCCTTSGCGDGRIVITAAKEHGARGVGIDIDPVAHRGSAGQREPEGVTKQVQFRVGDLFKTDFSRATVVTLYLLPDAQPAAAPAAVAPAAAWAPAWSRTRSTWGRSGRPSTASESTDRRCMCGPSRKRRRMRRDCELIRRAPCERAAELVGAMRVG